MIYLVDTNVMLRVADRAQTLNSVIRAGMRKLRSNGHALQAFSQNFVEFWNVSTRPAAKNGLDLDPSDAEKLLRLLERLFPLLPNDPRIYQEWRRLVIAIGVSGVQVHDARLVAAMKVHGATHILTLNTADFTRYASEGIQAVDPRTI